MRSLKFKWSLTLVITSLVGLVLVALLATQINVSEYKRFRDAEIEAQVADTASEYYAQFNTWEGIDYNFFSTTFRRSFRPPEDKQHFPFVIADADGVVIIPAADYQKGDSARPQDIHNGIPVHINGDLVGTLIITAPPTFDESEVRYLQRTSTALLIGGGGAIAVAILLGVFLSRQFLQPLVELTTAIESVKHGKFDQRVPVRTQDELGELARAFNQMGEELQRANKLRRQMTADIAHDLRTPLTVISGYLEGLRDGSLQPTQARFDTLYQESQLLKRLIEDLRTLSLADAGELTLVYQSVSPPTLLEQVIISFIPLAQSQKVNLKMSADPALPPIDIDRDRMAQVLGNLISNSLRFTPQYGEISLSAFISEQMMVFTVQDTGSGIAPEHLKNIFARFYRASESRQQNDSESGLGLAIAKSIVTAHQGEISAESVLGKGTTITICLPIQHE